MPSRNKTKLLLGVFFIGAAFLCVIATLYFLSQPDQADKIKRPLLNDPSAKLPREPSPVISSAVAEPMKLEALLRKAGDVYEPAEKNRKEGSLWLDRRSNNFIVTLGALHGLRQGSQLSIYDGSQKMDTASVEVTFDVIAYVKPQKISPDSFTGTYYRVVIEEIPPAK